MPRSAAPASGVIRWIASVAGRAGYLTALLLAVQSVLALCGVGYALILRALIDAATAGQTQTFVRSAIWLVSLMAFQIVLRAVDRVHPRYAGKPLQGPPVPDAAAKGLRRRIRRALRRVAESPDL